MVGLAVLGLFALLAATIGVLSPYDPVSLSDASQRMQAPSGSHVLGTDYAGRDLFTRIFFAARLSLLIGGACVGFSMAVGVPLGAAAGYFPGWIDMTISRLLDILLSFPSLLLAIVIAAPMGASLKTVILAGRRTGSRWGPPARPGQWLARGDARRAVRRQRQGGAPPPW
jgi:peptide/nickel transport system permease protein